MCSVFLSPLFALANGFRFIAIRLHDTHYSFVFPSLLLSLQMAFASPRSHYRTNVAVCFVFPSPFMCLQMAFASPQFHSFWTA